MRVPSVVSVVLVAVLFPFLHGTALDLMGKVPMRA
jgi:hypothetical protein